MKNELLQLGLCTIKCDKSRTIKQIVKLKPKSSTVGFETGTQNLK